MSRSKVVKALKGLDYAVSMLAETHESTQAEARRIKAEADNQLAALEAAWVEAKLVATKAEEQADKAHNLLKQEQLRIQAEVLKAQAPYREAEAVAELDLKAAREALRKALEEAKYSGYLRPTDMLLTLNAQTHIGTLRKVIKFEDDNRATLSMLTDVLHDWEVPFGPEVAWQHFTAAGDYNYPRSKRVIAWLGYQPVTTNVGMKYTAERPLLNRSEPEEA